MKATCLCFSNKVTELRIRQGGVSTSEDTSCGCGKEVALLHEGQANALHQADNMSSDQEENPLWAK